MDKDIAILKYEQGEIESVEFDLKKVTTCNIEQSEQLAAIQQKMKKANILAGKEMPQSTTTVMEVAETPELFDEKCATDPLSYDELFLIAEDSLIARGLDVDSLDYHSLVSKEELDQIEKELNRPLSRREKWVKGDFIAVFIAAAIGSLADIILSNRDNPLTGTNSDLSKWLNQFHKHEGGGPIDYQGPHFGGGFHRGLSKSHDILRFIEGIMMFKNGRFEAIRYENGIAHTVISTVNQYGTPYEQLSTIDAIVRYSKHMFADLFSTYSLPFPGSSFLVESSDRDLRKFAADMYHKGFNIKNVMCQGLSTIIIEVILRIYFSIQSVQKYKDNFELNEDYSNFEAVKHFFKPENKEKLDEMLLVAHSMVTAVNMGKVVIDKAPWEINVTEILSVVRYGVKVLNKAIERNSEYSKLIRSSGEIHDQWLALGQTFCLDEKSIIHSSPGLIIA